MNEDSLIFNGPSSVFQRIIDTEVNDTESINFRDFVTRVMDLKDGNFYQWIEERKEDPVTLIGYAESFSSIREHFIENFAHVLAELMQIGCIDKFYFQNPPLVLHKGLKHVFGDDIRESKHHYEMMSKSNLLNIHQEFKQNIVGQDDSLIEILSTLYPLVGRENEKPVVMMFYGPAGVGKTESAKIINDALSEGHLFRQQLSMFQTEEFASYLFGGSLENSSLAKDLINREGNVLLFDEFNRCPPGFHSAFFQMFDEGIYVDKNYEVDLRNSVIICTANYESKEEIISALGGPLFSRFDHFVSFEQLSIESKQILIVSKYESIIEQWDEEEQEILRAKSDLNELIEHADTFTNARNIEKGIKGYMARILVTHMLAEYADKEISIH